MVKYSIVIILGLICGLAVGFLLFNSSPQAIEGRKLFSKITSGSSHKRVIGFMPYWLVATAKEDYSKEINTLTYFGLTLDSDGRILKMLNEQETEPGWHMLQSGGMDDRLKKAKQSGITLSLLVFSADEDTIAEIISDPKTNADNMIEDIVPIMKKYGFTDLNIDIESVKEASDTERQQFTTFLEEVRHGVDRENLGTLSIDISPTALIKRYLIEPHDAARLTDYIVFMTYDYHYPGSYVTGPVAPLGGAGNISEFDTKVAIEEALRIMPPEKIVLGLPLYGYSWETMYDSPRSAVIPGSGLTASSRYIEEMMKTCDTCEISIEPESEESYIIYLDEETGTYHQIFYPDKTSTQEKLRFATEHDIGGVALWALGYENSDILDPLTDYLEGRTK